VSTVNGRVKRLVNDQGFGFIAADDGREYFFHRSGCHGAEFGDLREGQAVTLDCGAGRVTPLASEVIPKAKL
jgi:cold shock protein